MDLGRNNNTESRDSSHGENRIAIWPTPTVPAGRSSARIAIKAKGRILLIDPAEVSAVEAQGNYVVLHQTSNSHRLRESISTMEEKLNGHGFVRIHRSVIVNAAWVKEIKPLAGEYVLQVQGRDYMVTRTYRKNLQQLAQSWIGNCGFSAE
jgi:DNA-binding LytR/AlgR family response regulator